MTSPGSRSVLIGRVLVAGGVAAFWRGVTQRQAASVAAEADAGRESAWFYWCSFGVVLVADGVFVVVRS